MGLVFIRLIAVISVFYFMLFWQRLVCGPESDVDFLPVGLYLSLLTNRPLATGWLFSGGARSVFRPVLLFHLCTLAFFILNSVFGSIQV